MIDKKRTGICTKIRLWNLQLAKHLCMSACTHLNKALKSMLLDENIKAISHGVLKQMDLDLIQCEMFAEGGSELIKGLDVSFLAHVYGLFFLLKQVCFLDIRSKTQGEKNSNSSSKNSKLKNFLPKTQNSGNFYPKSGKIVRKLKNLPKNSK